MSTYPKGKVVMDHHHHKDKKTAKRIHYLSLFSAVIVTIILMAL